MSLDQLEEEGKLATNKKAVTKKPKLKLMYLLIIHLMEQLKVVGNPRMGISNPLYDTTVPINSFKPKVNDRIANKFNTPRG